MADANAVGSLSLLPFELWVNIFAAAIDYGDPVYANLSSTCRTLHELLKKQEMQQKLFRQLTLPALKNRFKAPAMDSTDFYTRYCERDPIIVYACNLNAPSSIRNLEALGLTFQQLIAANPVTFNLLAAGLFSRSDFERAMAVQLAAKSTRLYQTLVCQRNDSMPEGITSISSFGPSFDVERLGNWQFCRFSHIFGAEHPYDATAKVKFLQTEQQNANSSNKTNNWHQYNTNGFCLYICFADFADFKLIPHFMDGRDDADIAKWELHRRYVALYVKNVIDLAYILAHTLEEDADLEQAEVLAAFRNHYRTQVLNTAAIEELVEAEEPTEVLAALPAALTFSEAANSSQQAASSSAAASTSVARRGFRRPDCVVM